MLSSRASCSQRARKAPANRDVELCAQAVPHLPLWDFLQWFNKKVWPRGRNASKIAHFSCALIDFPNARAHSRLHPDSIPLHNRYHIHA